MDALTKKGTLITFEGIDGSGKSSAARALYESLRNNYAVLLTREPGATELGSVLRTLLQNRTFDVCARAEYLLFAADRAQHMVEVVKPALDAGKIVISDRMADSSFAYQGFGRGVDPAMITQVNQWALMRKEPDLTLYLKIDYHVARKRLSMRNEQETVFEQEREAFFERVAKGFEKVFSQRSQGHAVIEIDASKSQEVVHQAVLEAVTKYLIQQRAYESSPSVFMDRA